MRTALVQRMERKVCLKQFLCALLMKRKGTLYGRAVGGIP